jgi:hypothetical protein
LLEDERQLVALDLPGLRLVRKDGTWQREPAVKHKEQEISGDRINEFVAHWQHARALSVARLTNKPALQRIRLTSETGDQRQTLTLDILAYKPEFVLARRDEGLEYHFPADVGQRLLSLTASE